MNSPYRVLSEAYPSPRAVSPGQGSATARVSVEKKVRQVDTLLMLVSRDNAMNSASRNVKISSHKKTLLAQPASEQKIPDNFSRTSQKKFSASRVTSILKWKNSIGLGQPRFQHCS
jgi:hypothetical protein